MTSLAELQDLRGKVALVTGASGGIGRVICRTLAELGADIALLDRNDDALQKLAAELRNDLGVNAQPILMDLEAENQRLTVVDRICEHFSGLNVLINNAAFVGDSRLTGWAVKFEHQEIDTWRRAFEVNLTACFHLCQLLTPMLSQGDSGSIVNIGSIYGIVGPDWRLYSGTSMGNPAAYAASKGGLIQLTRWLSTVLAPRIRVNCISPGGVFRGQPQNFVDEYVARTPLGRMATEEDFMGAIAFLSSGLSKYVTGQNLVIDGGWTVW